MLRLRQTVDSNDALISSDIPITPLLGAKGIESATSSTRPPLNDTDTGGTDNLRHSLIVAQVPVQPVVQMQKPENEHLAQTEPPRSERKPVSPHEAASWPQSSLVDKKAAVLPQENPFIDVQVHIGRIDIRATPKTTPPAQTTKAKAQNTMTLNDYIQQRTADRR
jgi:hypothetical protein